MTFKLIAVALPGLILASAALAQRGASPPPSTSPGPARAAQVPSVPLPEGTGSIAGRLFDRESKAPIAGTTIEIEYIGAVPNSARSTERPNFERHLTTDATGRFRVDRVAIGPYLVRINLEGYAEFGATLSPRSLTKTVQLTLNEPTADLVLPFSRIGSIRGAARDGSTPLAHVEVRLYRRTFDRVLYFSGARTQVTDDAGSYAFEGLSPGDYIVSVYCRSKTTLKSVALLYRSAAQAGRGGEALLNRFRQTNAAEPVPVVNPQLAIVGDADILTTENSTLRPPPALAPTIRDGATWVYRTTYFPAATSFAQATHIQLKAGETRTGVDITMTREPTVTLSGMLTGAKDAVSYVGVRLVLSDVGQLAAPGGAEAAATVSDPAGKFVFRGMPPGRYSVKATIASLAPVTLARPGAGRGPAVPPLGPITSFASRTVVVGQTDLAAVTVPLRAPLSVSGAIVLEDSAVSGFSGAASLTGRLQVLLVPASGMSSPVPATPTFDGDHFVLQPVVAGRYMLQAESFDHWTVAAVTRHGQSVMNRQFDVTDQDLSGFEIVLTTTGGRLDGDVHDAAGKAMSGANVFVFPADYRGWIANGMSINAGHQGRTASTGRFSIADLPPGDYLAVALSAEDTKWPDPESVTALARKATPIRVDSGKVSSISLTLTSSR